MKHAARVVLLALTALGPIAAPPAHADATPVQRAVAWLANESTWSRPDMVAAAVGSAGIDPGGWPTPTRSVLSALDAFVPTYVADEKGPPVHPLHDASVGGYERPEMVAQVLANFSNGGFGGADTPPWNAFAVLALRAAGLPAADSRIQSAAQRLLADESPQGSWGVSDSNGAPPDTDTTGMVLAALADAGVDLQGDVRIATFLNSTHVLGGGHSNTVALGTGGANCQSTVWALHGYAAIAVPPPSDDLGFLTSLQNPDGGLAEHPGEADDELCTAEATIALAGFRYPLPGIVPLALASPNALDEGTLSLPPAYHSATWTFPDGSTAEGTSVTHVFPAAGVATFALDASGPQAIHRGSASLQVLPPRPVVVAPADLAALRRVAVQLDVSSSFDPDGSAIAAWRVDWGDGNVTNATTHAYDLPGDRDVTLRALAASGVWSLDAHVAVHVVDRAPTIGGLPARVVADRLTTVDLAPVVGDPDGDPVSVAWSTDGAAAGTGSASVRFATLGSHDVRFVATDPFGANATADVRVDVLDLPPRLSGLALPTDPRANESLRLHVDAGDPDGPPPAVAWTIDGSVAGNASDVEVRLPAGLHDVRIVATDAEGSRAWLNATLHVLPPEAPPPSTGPTPSLSAAPTAPPADDAPAPPALLPPLLEAQPDVVAGRAARLVVRLAEAGAVIVELGDGATADATDLRHVWSVPGDYEVRATETTPDGRVASSSLVLHVATPAPPASPPRGTAEAGSRLNASSLPASPSPPPPPAPASTRAGAKAAPLGWIASAAALLLAAAGTRRRRA